MGPGPDVNAVGRMLGLLGDEWTLLIAQQALLDATRYAEFADRLPISHAVLTRRLTMMTDAELLNRVEYQLNPPRYEYRLTGRGRSLWPVLVSIWDWERRWVPEHDLPALRHGLCGRTFSPELTCRACGSLTDEKSLVAQWGPSGSWPRSMPVSATRRRSHGDRGGQAELFPQTMSILGNRWSFAVMVAAFVGTTRFTDFADQLGAPPGSLADRLQILVGNDVLTVSDGRYRLTEKGRAVLPIIVTALDWAQRWFATPEGPAVIVTHTRCANEFHAQLACDQCQESVRGSEIGQQPT
ncbi:winged helix-turn-helix transcriptional regulator [Mycolicibacterium llatzerense]|uniref:winged helix-turn-helix transcriptional regulator n=1 Tax=Mycolicibacterium llatzerense TaxID=280871 RepID=UPI0021B5A062|nr:helix-turn-helix domain-containing protein [Mycolicibacterium llatzerense]